MELILELTDVTFRDVVNKMDDVGLVAIIVLEDGTIETVGSTNTMGGGCDCCGSVKNSTKIKKAKIYKGEL